MTFVGRENNMQILREYFYLEVLISSLLICITQGETGATMVPPPSLYVYCFYMFTRFARVLIGHRLLRRQILFPTLEYIPTFQPQENIFCRIWNLYDYITKHKGKLRYKCCFMGWLMRAGVRADTPPTNSLFTKPLRCGLIA
jgi:hypothetical protein